jgi:hypothetical protein
MEKTDAIKLNQEVEAYRDGFKDGYNAGFSDGKLIHCSKDNKIEVD